MPKESSSKSIRVKFRLSGPKNSEHEFKFLPHSSIQKISNIYCESLDLCLQDVKFYHKGSQINETDTLLSLNIKDGDAINVIKSTPQLAIIPEVPEHIKIKVLISADSAIEFKTLRNDPLKKLMDVFCDRRKILRRQTSFLYDGICIKDVDTPSSLDMEDGDIIEVVNMFGNNKDEKLTRDKKYIILKVLGQDGSVVKFRVLRDDPLEKLMDAYCEHLLKNKQEIRFNYDGNRIHDGDTPTTLNMEHIDIIEVYQVQLCG